MMQQKYTLVIYRHDGDVAKVILGKRWGVFGEGPAEELDAEALLVLAKQMQIEAYAIRRKLAA